MVLSRLLEFTDPEEGHTGTAARDADRPRWALLRDRLAGFPLVDAPDGSGPVFAEAETDDPLRPPPATSNANYPITHLAAVFPAGVITSDMAEDQDGGEGGNSGGESLAAIGRRTAALMNRVTAFSPGNGFVLSWPPAALLAEDGPSGGQLLRSFSTAYAGAAKPNGWPDLGGGGLEQMGAIEAIHALMLRTGRRGELSVFPAWPQGSTTVSFVRLRSVLALELVQVSRGPP